MSVWAFFVWYSVVRPSELSLLFTPYLFFRLLQIDWMQSKRSISFHLSPFSPSVKGRGKKLANAYCMRALHVQIITHPLDRKREREGQWAFWVRQLSHIYGFGRAAFIRSLVMWYMKGPLTGLVMSHVLAIGLQGWEWNELPLIFRSLVKYKNTRNANCPSSFQSDPPEANS